jgi:hypothetical protein
MAPMNDAAGTRRALQRVAVHIVARARQQATGRFSLRVAPGGFATPEFGSDARRVRVSRGLLVVESDAESRAGTVARRIAGASLRELAAVAAVDIDRALDVGHDSPEPGDPDEPIVVDLRVVDELAGWFALVAAALDRVVASVEAASSSPSLTRLWPEHFDVALDLAAKPGVRANLGGSPGDEFSSDPYLYVGPWTDDRPGEPGFWNAPFGAACLRSALNADDPVEAAAGFFLDGLRRLAGQA